MAKWTANLLWYGLFWLVPSISHALELGSYESSETVDKVRAGYAVVVQEQSDGTQQITIQTDLRYSVDDSCALLVQMRERATLQEGTKNEFVQTHLVYCKVSTVPAIGCGYLSAECNSSSYNRVSKFIIGKAGELCKLSQTGDTRCYMKSR